MIRERTTWGLLFADTPFGTVDTARPPTLRAITTTHGGVAPPSCHGYPRWSPTGRRQRTTSGGGRTTGALCQRSLVVDVAVASVLLAAVGPTSGHADFTKENRAVDAPTHKLKQLIPVARWSPGMVTGPLGDQVAEESHGVTQAGHQGPRGAAAEFPGVASLHARSPLRNAIRGDVVVPVDGNVGGVMVFHGFEGDDEATPGASHEGGGGRDRRRRTLR